MNRILFSEEQPGYELPANDVRFEHVRGVLRMQVGDVFDIGVYNGRLGRATITSLTRQTMHVAVAWGDRPPLPSAIWLVMGLCRPATVKKILRTIPTLGVRGLYFYNSEKSLQAYGGSRIWEKDGWHERLVEGVEQAFTDTFIPEVTLEENLASALQRVPWNASRIALDLYECHGRLRDLKLTPDTPICLAIGPERGWGNNDRKEQSQHGFKRLTMGDRVMKVETATVAALAILTL